MSYTILTYAHQSYRSDGLARQFYGSPTYMAYLKREQMPVERDDRDHRMIMGANSAPRDGEAG